MLIFAAASQASVLTLAVGVGLLVGVAVFVVLYWKNRPPPPLKRLAVVRGSAAGQGMPVTGRIRIGRDKENELCIEDDELSRFHCEIRTDTGVAVLVDMKSANGTRVNGKDVRATALRPGDEIEIGRQVLRCS